MKALNILLVMLFVLSAALQYNDPDPYIWMPVYLYGALLCFFAIKKRFLYAPYIIGLAIYVSFATYLFFDKTGVLNWATNHQAENIVQSMKATKPWIEETREFFGLFLLIIALVANIMWLSKKTSFR